MRMKGVCTKDISQRRIFPKRSFLPIYFQAKRPQDIVNHCLSAREYRVGVDMVSLMTVNMVSVVTVEIVVMTVEMADVQPALKTEMMMTMMSKIIMIINHHDDHCDEKQVVDAVQAALKTEMREIKKIQEALRQLADEVHHVRHDADDADDDDSHDEGYDDVVQVEGQLHENERVSDKLKHDLRQKR